MRVSRCARRAGNASSVGPDVLLMGLALMDSGCLWDCRLAIRSLHRMSDSSRSRLRWEIDGFGSSVLINRKGNYETDQEDRQATRRADQGVGREDRIRGERLQDAQARFTQESLLSGRFERPYDTGRV